MKKARKLLRIVFGRTMFVVLFLLIQLGILLAGMLWLTEYVIYFYGIYLIFSAAVLIYILNEDSNPSFKIAWMVPVLVFPVFGCLFYLFVQLQIGTKLMAKRHRTLVKETKPWLEQENDVETKLCKENVQEKNLASYVKTYGGFPIYENTTVKYFPLGEEKFEALKQELRAAKHFIFLEYFIVERGSMWNTILEILEEKVKEGVEVRMMYDGMCCLVLLPYHYPETLQAKGIQCKMFAPIRPALSTYQNNRDHRKIVVIDGHTAFTGGINLADEYINQKIRFGHWKDTGIMIKGDAVKSFTMMFLQMWDTWNVTECKSYEYEKYVCKQMPQTAKQLQMREGGFVMPYGDSPTDKENVGELVYMDILNRAQRYVHIMTPYLILDHEMETALMFAAKRGVEVIIMMPHIPDKPYAYLLARSFYEELLRAGVKIYEYTPGFVHAKSFVSDDERAVVGTINLDYRSLYLHFECAVYLYQNQGVLDVERDFQETLKKCQEITIKDCREYPLWRRSAGRVLRLIAPLM